MMEMCLFEMSINRDILPQAVTQGGVLANERTHLYIYVANYVCGMMNGKSIKLALTAHSQHKYIRLSPCAVIDPLPS
jgi:hypothetical protein